VLRYRPGYRPGRRHGCRRHLRVSCKSPSAQVIAKANLWFLGCTGRQNVTTFLVCVEWAKVTVAGCAGAPQLGPKGVSQQWFCAEPGEKPQGSKAVASTAGIGSTLGNRVGNPRADWGIPPLGWAVRVGGEWLTLGASFWVACPLVQVILAEFGASGGPGGCVSRLPQLTKDSVAKLAWSAAGNLRLPA